MNVAILIVLILILIALILILTNMRSGFIGLGKGMNTMNGNIIAAANPLIRAEKRLNDTQRRA